MNVTAHKHIARDGESAVHLFLPRMKQGLARVPSDRRVQVLGAVTTGNCPGRKVLGGCVRGALLVGLIGGHRKRSRYFGTTETGGGELTHRVPLPLRACAEETDASCHAGARPPRWRESSQASTSFGRHTGVVALIQTGAGKSGLTRRHRSIVHGETWRRRARSRFRSNSSDEWEGLMRAPHRAQPKPAVESATGWDHAQTADQAENTITSVTDAALCPRAC